MYTTKASFMDFYRTSPDYLKLYHLINFKKQHNIAFQKLKHSLKSAPVLSTPDYSKDFIPQTDASDRGIGAVLGQQDEHGSDKPIAR